LAPKESAQMEEASYILASYILAQQSDRRRAFDLLTALPKLSADATLLLSELYATGVDGIEKDIAKAIDLYQTAKGLTPAQTPAHVVRVASLLQKDVVDMALQKNGQLAVDITDFVLGKLRLQAPKPKIELVPFIPEENLEKKE